MLRPLLRATWSRKRRLASTTLAVVLGIAFLTATLVLGDSARAGFRTSFAEANAGTDAVVRSGARLTGGEQALRPPIPASTLDVVRSVDGVGAAVASVEGTAQVLDADGDPIGGNGPPTVGAAWIDDPELTGWQLDTGRSPRAPGEVVLDRGTAEEAGVSPGDEVTVLVPRPVEATVVGTVAFGEEDSLGGTTYAGFALPTAGELLLGGTDRISGVVVAAEPGVAEDELVSRLAAVLPEGAEALTGTALTAEQEADIEGDFLGAMRTALVAFAVVALLVAALSIFNTFSILVAQRTRESALLRALGASRPQVLGSAVFESLLVGLVGAALGLGAGILVAAGGLALLEGAGFGLPTDGTVLTGGAATTAMVAGVAVTLAGGLLPAWRSSRVAPVAALRETAVDSSGTSVVRAVLGGLVAAGGVLLLLVGVREGGMGATGIGGVLLLGGMVLLGPVVARPVAGLIGRPLALRGVPGDLARRNAGRNPRRTAAAATALLVGVGVVTLFSVIGASVSRSIEETVDRTFGGDLVVTPSGGWGGAGLETAFADELAGRPEVAAAAGIGFGAATIDGRQEEIAFTDPASLAAVADVEPVEGTLGEVGPGEVAMGTEYAEEHGYAVGDPVTMVLADGRSERWALVATYDQTAMAGNVLADRRAWAAHDPAASYRLVMVDLAEGVAPAEGRAAIERLADGRGAPEVQDREGFVASQAAEVDVLLTVIYALLAVAIVIALMGIANTLSLSVHERTRELGLLRAVGQTRSQLRAMVRWESVLVATFGAVGGTGLGLVVGWAVMSALRSAEGFGTFAMPVGTITTVLVVGAVAGVLAGLRPAWRASRLDVLAAVAVD